MPKQAARRAVRMSATPACIYVLNVCAHDFVALKQKSTVVIFASDFDVLKDFCTFCKIALNSAVCLFKVL